MNPFLTAGIFTVFLPGSGHLYLGKKRKGFSLLFLFALSLITFFSSSLLILKVLMIGIYFAMVSPFLIELFLLKNRPQAKSLSETKPYILLMLLISGFGALPLLWQSDIYSYKMKLVLTLVVFLLALIFLTGLWCFKTPLETFLNQIFNQ